MKRIKDFFKKFRKLICGCDCYMCKYCSCYENNFNYQDWEDYMDFDTLGYETTVPPKEKKSKKTIAPVKAVKKIAKKVVKKNKQ